MIYFSHLTEEDTVYLSTLSGKTKVHAILVSHKSIHVNTEDRKHTHNIPYTFCCAVNKDKMSSLILVLQVSARST